MATAQEEAPPPSYNSIFSQFKAIKDESGNNPLTIASKVSGLVSGSIFIVIGLLCHSILPFVGIIIGGVHINDCSMFSNIPIWLIVYGVFGVISALISAASNTYHFVKKRSDPEYQTHKGLNFKGIIDLFLFIWLIVGSAWVYPYYTLYQSDNSNLINYCERTVYLYSFSVITIYWCVIGLVCLCCCLLLPIICCVGCCCAARAAKYDT